MRLPIKSEYFAKIKSGEKTIEFRDAHITFVDEDTSETIVREVTGVYLRQTARLPQELRTSGLFDDKWVIAFELAHPSRSVEGF